MESTDRESISKHIFLQTDSASHRERCCQSPVRGEASCMAKAYVGRRPTPKAEGMQEGEVPREGGDSRGKRAGEYTRWLEARGLPSRRRGIAVFKYRNICSIQKISLSLFSTTFNRCPSTIFRSESLLPQRMQRRSK